MKKMRLVIPVILAVACLFAAAWAQESGPAFISSSQATYRVVGSSGPPTAIYSNIGRATLILFWASWCMPCIAETPQINHLQATYAAAGLNIVAMSVDDMPESRIELLVKKFEMIYPVAVPSPELVRDFHVHAIPAAFLYGPDGKLVQQWIGPTSAEEIEKQLTKIMPAKTAKIDKDPAKPDQETPKP
jgi:thiol-disulfide isomerase/thioredoxin